MAGEEEGGRGHCGHTDCELILCVTGGGEQTKAGCDVWPGGW